MLLRQLGAEKLGRNEDGSWVRCEPYLWKTIEYYPENTTSYAKFVAGGDALRFAFGVTEGDNRRLNAFVRKLGTKTISGKTQVCVKEDIEIIR